MRAYSKGGVFEGGEFEDLLYFKQKRKNRNAFPSLSE